MRHSTEFLLQMQHAVRSGSLGRRLLKGGGWVAIGKVGIIVTGTITNALLTRILSPEEVGIYYLALSIVTTTALIGQLGLGKTVIRLLGEAKGQATPGKVKGTISTVVRVGFAGTIAVALVYLVLGKQIALSAFNSVELGALTGLVALTIVPVALGDLFADAFLGLQDFRFAEIFAGRGLLRGILISLGFGLLWLVKGDTTLTEVLLITVSSGSVSVALALWVLHIRMANISAISERIPAQQVLAIAWPILLTTLIPILSNQGTLWILGALRPPSEVGVFGTVMKFAVLVSTPSLLYGEVVSTFIAELYAQDRKVALERMLRYVATLISGITLIIVLVLGLWGEDVLGLVYGDYYRTGAMALVLLMIGQLINVITGPCGQLLLMSGNQHYFFRISMIAGSLAIFVSFWLVGPWGYIGAALGQITYTIIATLLATYFSYRLTGIKTWIGFRE